MMDLSAFEERLIHTAVNRGLLWGILALVVAVTLAVEVIHYRKTGDNSGVHLGKFFFPGAKNRKLKHTTRQQIGLDIAALAVLAAVMLMNALPVWRDVSGQQYVMVEAQYERTESSSEANLFSNGYVYARTEDGRLDLRLPAGWTAEEFPLGTYSGTIWYSEQSKIILSFTP